MSPEPPRTNGELVFAEPWHARAFGLVMTLVETGAFTYDEFQARLVEQVPRRPGYYDAWLAALEDVLVARDLVDGDAVTARAGALAHDDGH